MNDECDHSDHITGPDGRCPDCGELLTADDDHSASRRVDVLREEAPHLIASDDPDRDALAVAIDALEFRLEWLDDYGQREYGSEAVDVIARYQQALDTLRAQAPDEETSISSDELDRIRGALDDLATIAADPRRDVSTLGIDLLDIHTLIAGTLLLNEDDDEQPRTILVHVNVELPTDAPATADDIADEIRAAIEIATDDSSATENMPGLTSGAWSIPLAEEV